MTIHCKDDYLTTIDAATGYYRDPTSSNRQVNVVRTGPLQQGVTNACGQQVAAFSYSCGPGCAKIILCSDWSGGALNKARNDEIGDWIKSDIRGISQGMDFLAGFLSYTILHEMMHSSDFNQCLYFQPSFRK